VTAYTITPVGLGGRLLHGRAEKVVGWDLRLIEENERLRSELDEARRVAAGAQRLKERLEAETALRVRSQQWLFRVAQALADIAADHPEVREAVEAAREEIWGGNYGVE
jgi:hypothetical protein